MNDQPAWKTLGANTTAPPEDSSVQDGYVLLLVLVSIFIGGTLVLLSGILIICRKCCETDRRYLRASEDAEKTNTTYLDDSQPTQEITIKVDDSDCLSSSSYHDVETERFLSTCSTGRRVSFNEASLFDHEKKAQEKGRRYTLTEGDFHHLKNARLTHLAIPPPALKIVTIHECESTENTSIPMTMCRPSSSRSNLSIFQQALGSLPQTALASHSTSPSLALPGDTFNSTVDTSFIEVSPPMSSDSGESVSAEAVTGTSKGNSGGSSGTAEAAVSSSQGTVLQFFTKLRRHTSLEGASPYFKIKKWKFESSQRASSLDTRGSPKRHQFQRQRAASESMDQEDQDPHQTDFIKYIARTNDVTFHSPPVPFLPPPSSPAPSLGRLDAAEIAASSSEVAEGMDSIEQQTAYRDIWNLRASLELYASLDQSSSNDKDSVRSDADSVCSFGGLPSFPSQDAADELESFEEKSMPSQKTKQDSVESERGSDGESGTRKLLQMDSGYASIEAPTRPLEDIRMFGTGEKDKTASEKRRFFTTSGHKATVFESFESQLFNEELEEEGAVGGEVEPSMGWSPYGQMFITRDYLHRRDYSIDEKTDALFNEFLRHDPQFDDSPLKTKHRSRIHLRKQWQRTKQYSDPGVRYPSAFERHRTPLRRGDSVSDPLDNRYHSTLPRIISTADEEYSEGCSGTDHTRSGTPDSTELNLCEGKSADPEIRDKVQNIDEETSEQSAVLEQLDHTETSDSKHTLGHISQFTGADDHLTLGYGPQTIGAELLDKISTNIEDRLYTNFKRSKDSPEFLVAVAHTSPDHSPV
ncbi:voltage-dependent calcium channel beta subunit-associated regulatory protein isoform X2 [Protopterus annectens]|uniref:voltage-dependent calcium channel beta subunit-associated regulatory protein isoform X2 n=1 Tax=Protopterus annectens TaxID=7888 RepID=UPI001CFA0A84|nr:voltage-dependent calcium channel beta subunit-associated regulatory protein isoform X2 [Protopterus annectens]